MPEPSVVSRAALREWILGVLKRPGMFVAEAEVVADQLLWADAHDLPQFGTRRLPELFDALDLGDIDPRAQTLTINEGAGFALIDGSTGTGHVAVARAVDLLAEKTRAAGTATIVVQNSRAAGPLPLYALRGAFQNLLTIVCCNPSQARLIQDDGARVPGDDHVLCCGAPLGGGQAVAFAPRLSRVNWSDIATAGESGVALPDGFAVSREGVPTTQPSEAHLLTVADTALSPFLGVFASTLSGLLAGGKSCLEKQRTGLGGAVEYFLFAAAIERFTDLNTFQTRMQNLHRQLPDTASTAKIYADTVPETIRLSTAHREVLEELATRLRVPVPW